MDVRAKQRLSYQSLLLNSELCGGGFAPRHLNRYMLRGKIDRMLLQRGLKENLKENL